MRYLLLVPFCLAAVGCSGGDDASAGNAAAAAAATPATMPPGQYATEFEVTQFRQTDNNPTPAVKAKQGDKVAGSGCVSNGSLPPPELFTGEGYKCTYKYNYIKGGIINASLGCTINGKPGDVTMTVQGSYTADSFEAQLETNTYFPGNGDFAMSRKVIGHLTGPSCAPAAGDAGGNASAAKTG
jgi:hypothetical protein